jgi:hypothetical protein
MADISIAGGGATCWERRKFYSFKPRGLAAPATTMPPLRGCFGGEPWGKKHQRKASPWAVPPEAG